MLDRVLRVMRPLVRLLLRHGVTYPAFAAALKRVFLDAARAELESRGMARTDSALTLLSGVHRRDVRQLTRGAAAPESAPASAAGAFGLATEVVGRWLSDPAFEGRALPRGGADGFDALVAGVSSDVRPRAVLDELLRLGAVREDEAGVHLDQAGFIPRQGLDEMSRLFAANLHDHAAAAVANLAGEANFLEQAVFVDEITPESATELQRAAVAAWRVAFKSVMARARQRFEHDARHAPAAARTQRARFGVYYFSDTDSHAGDTGRRASERTSP